MAQADTIIAVVGAITALATVWLAYLALGKARDTLDEAKTARLDGRASRQGRRRRAARSRGGQAAVDRREADYDRERRRLERVGQMVEDLFWAADLARRGGQVAAGNWISQRNVLRHALVSLHSQLPAATELLNSATPDQAFGPASQARNEIERALDELTRERPVPISE